MQSELAPESVSTENDARSREVVRIVQTLVDTMGVSATVSIAPSPVRIAGAFVCRILVSEGSHLLIGQHGLNLEALQTVARLIARRSLDGWADFSLDVNNYRSSKMEALIEEVRAAERDVRQNRSVAILRPMTAFERKCVHTLLAESEFVETESSGTGIHRKVVVKPKSEI